MNTEILSFLGRCITTTAVYVFVNLLFSNIYDKKYSKRSVYIFGCIIAIAVMVGISGFGNGYLNLAFSFLTINMLCIVLYCSNVKNIWLNNTLIWFMFSFTDAATVLIWFLVTNNTLDGILSDYQLMLGSNLMNIIIMFVVYKVYMAFKQKLTAKSIQLKMAAFYVAMMFFELYIVISYASNIIDSSKGIQIIIILLGFLILNLFFAYILNQVSESYKYKYELSLADRLKKIQLENYKEIDQKYRESRAIIHDIKKHMMVIDELRVNDDNSNQYTKRIYEQMDKLFFGFHCSNQILSIVLSQKISKAKSNGIDVNIEMAEVQFNFMSDLDITAIFANLWDNAIEACDKAIKNKYINMKISCYNNFVIINCQNSFNGEYIKQGISFLSTKKQHDGIGLSSIEASVKKYDGIFSVKADDNTFEIDITIPTPIH